MKKRLLIFTAGTSLRENLQDPAKGFGGESLVKNFLPEGAGAWGYVLREPEELRKELVLFAEPFAKLDLANSDNLPRATAEMSSFYLLQVGEQADDELVLLCSDTGDGAFCALVNAMLLGEQVHFHDDKHPDRSFTVAGFSEAEVGVEFNDALKAIRLPQVELRVVKKLNAKQPQTFETVAIPNLVKTMADLHYNRASKDVPTILNITGGFKAAIPTLAQSAAVAEGIKLTCLYEEAQTMIMQPLIQIELEAEAQQRLLERGESYDAPPPWLQATTWAGLENRLGRAEWGFYEKMAEGDGVTLSSLGLAMRELLRSKARWQETDR